MTGQEEPINIITPTKSVCRLCSTTTSTHYTQKTIDQVNLEKHSI